MLPHFFEYVWYLVFVYDEHSIHICLKYVHHGFFLLHELFHPHLFKVFDRIYVHIHLVIFPCEPSEVEALTVMFKQIRNMIELSSLVNKLGVEAPMFFDAWIKQEKYMKQNPTAHMTAPDFMLVGIHVQRVVGGPVTAFRGAITDEELTKNRVNQSDLATLRQSIVIKKVHDITAKAEDCHSKLRLLFKQQMFAAFMSDAVIKKQIDAVVFAVHFEKGHCSKSLEDAERVIQSKSNPIANALVAFSHGRAVLVSAITKAKQQTQEAATHSSAVGAVEDVVENFPALNLETKSANAGNKLSAIFDGLDKDDKAGRDAMVSLIQPHLNELQKKVSAYYADNVFPEIKKLVASMDFDAAVDVGLQIPPRC